MNRYKPLGLINMILNTTLIFIVGIIAMGVVFLPQPYFGYGITLIIASVFVMNIIGASDILKQIRPLYLKKGYRIFLPWSSDPYFNIQLNK
jgi:hypothetical protein